MADAEAVVSSLPDDKTIEYIGLVLNKRGLLRALATREGGKRGVDEVGAVAVASDTFGAKNQGQTSAESVQISKEIVQMAQEHGMSAQVTVSTAFGCPFEGRVAQETVIRMVDEIAAANPREIAIADTIGVASPMKVAQLCERLREMFPELTLRAHFHNTTQYRHRQRMGSLQSRI